MKKLFKNPYFSALIIGILATALWENFISPFCRFVFIHISSLMELFISTFLNGTYAAISNGFSDLYTIFVLMFIFLGYMMLLLSPFIYELGKKYADNLLEKVKKENKNPQPKINKTILSTKILIIVDLSLLALLYIYLIGNFIFINDCITTSLGNIEIESPYISDVELKH